MKNLMWAVLFATAFNAYVFFTNRDNSKNCEPCNCAVQSNVAQKAVMEDDDDDDDDICECPCDEDTRYRDAKLALYSN